MNPYNTLDPSLFSQHDAHSTPQNNISQNYLQATHETTTQNHNEFRPPPGAGPMGPPPPPPPPPPTQPYLERLSSQGSLLQGHTEMRQHASRPFPMDVQTDESDAFYSPSPSRSASLSPSLLHPSQAPVPGFRHSTNSQVSSYLPSSSRSYPYTHIRASSQPPPQPTTVLGDGSSLSPYSSVQMASKLSSAMQPEQLPTPAGVNISLLPPSGSPRHYSEADRQNVQNAHGLLVYDAAAAAATQTMYPSPPALSGFSTDPAVPHNFSPGFTDPVPWPPSGVYDGDSVVNFDSPIPSSSPDSIDDSVRSMLSDPPPPSSTITPGSIAPSHIPGHRHPSSLHRPHASSSTSSSSSTLGPERTRRRNGRRNSEPPRDQRATTRLYGQRRSDDENTEALYKLFVPPGAERRWKKDRLGIILHYATQLVARYNSLVEYHERNRDAREVQLAQSDERLQQSQEELEGRHGEISMQAEHWNTTNDGLDRTLTNVEHGMHHYQRNSL